jgi:perosamine synthetase
MAKAAPVADADLTLMLGAVESVVGERPRPVALHEPVFGGNEWLYTKECLDTGWVSSAGKFVDRFEGMLAERTGAKHAVAVVNGTAALELALKLAGVAPGDQVIVPTLTFVATANAVAHCGAVPHLADVDPRTLGLDASKLADHLSRVGETRGGGLYDRGSGARIAAIVVMHTFGHPADLDHLKEVCDRYAVPMVEDAAESLGTLYKGRHTGTVGRLGALSFNGNKVVTTGGGGAILTDDPLLGRRAKHLTTTARQPHRWAFLHDEVGYNYRLPNLNAALGCAQLEQLDAFLERKRALARRYLAAFEGIRGASIFAEVEGARSNYWLNAMLFDRNTPAGSRDRFLELTNDKGIQTRPVWTLMHHLPMFRDCPRMDLSAAEDLESRVVNLPSSASL